MFQPRDLDWTPERIRRFWDFFSSQEALAEQYFARTAGRSIIRYVSRRIDIGTAVDFGCGGGDLIGYLLETNEAYGIDQSPESVARVNNRFRNHPRFRGAFVEADIPPVDTAFMLEVVEHMDDEALGVALEDARRSLKQGGHLVLSTPNEENLDALKVMCPDCGSIFHRVQHVRSWSARSLSEYVERFGFRTVSAEATVLSPYTGLKDLMYRTGYRWLRPHLPNLIYVGAV